MQIQQLPSPLCNPKEEVLYLFGAEQVPGDSPDSDGNIQTVSQGFLYIQAVAVGTVLR
jgi:hypothetical protein